MMENAITASKTASSGSDAETIVFTPQWTPQAQFAGYYVAEAKGFFREAGVKVKIEHPSATQPALTSQSGKDSPTRDCPPNTASIGSAGLSLPPE